MTEYILGACLIFLAANAYTLGRQYETAKIVWFLAAALFLVMQIRPSIQSRKLKKRRLRICKEGCVLLRAFLLSTACSIAYSLAGFFGMLRVGSLIADPKLWLAGTLISICVHAVAFWNGLIRIYVSSGQLGVKWRVIGGLCGMIPVVNLIVLSILIRTAEREADFENEKILRDESRKEDKICATRYPLLLVHGVFFRDFRYFNYWGRVPEELERNGAVIYYGNHPSAASVAECGEVLAVRIRQILEETGAEKVNIIAHSKGGLDCRYALARCGVADRVASLTTVSTPHRGCEFADCLLSHIPVAQQELVAETYNRVLRALGEENADFMAAVRDLTAGACRARNEEIMDVPGVYYQSVGSIQTKAVSGRFPLNVSWHLVKHFEGRNDGLVGEDSFPWGESYQLVTPGSRRGISHADMIDLARENIDGFDVREFYVQRVHGLKEKGF